MRRTDHPVESVFLREVRQPQHLFVDRACHAHRHKILGGSDDDAGPWTIAARGLQLTPPRKTTLAPHGQNCKSIVYSPDRLLYPMKRVDFDPFPWQSFAVWIMTQMKRWGQIKGDVDYPKVAAQVFAADQCREVMKSLGYKAPEIAALGFEESEVALVRRRLCQAQRHQGGSRTA